MTASRLSRRIALVGVIAMLLVPTHAVLMTPSHAHEDEMQSSVVSALCIVLAVVAGAGLVPGARRRVTLWLPARGSVALAIPMRVGLALPPPECPSRASPSWLQRFLR